MTKSQRSYTIWQYNKARVNRELDPIENVYSKGNNPDTITPRSNPIMEMFKQSHWSSTPPPFNSEIHAAKEFEDSELEELLNDPEFHNFLDNPQPSGSGIQNQIETPIEVDEVEISEGIDEEMPGQGNKRARPNDAADSNLSTGSKTVAGGRGYSGGFGQDMGPNTMVPQPKNFSNSGGLSFHQVHRFTSKGSAYAVIVGSATTGSLTANDQSMQTPLAEIPWDRPFMYMTPRDYNALPPGSYAKSVSISITCRNPQIGFETGGSTSTQATLNHNKHIITAVGLNTRTVGTNRKVTFGTASAPMVPTTSVDATYNTFQPAMYGYGNSEADFTSNVPASLFGVDIVLENYYAMWAMSKVFADANPTSHKGGWPSLIEHIQEFNMNDFVGGTILQEEYHFKRCPLKAQLRAINCDSTTLHDYPSGSEQKQMDRITINTLPALDLANTTEQFRISQMSKNAFPIVGYNEVMERGAYCQSINKGSQSVPVQPSIHIAMKPIPKISGTIVNRLPTEWTTVNAFFEVECKLEVGFAMPNHYPHGGSTHNVEIEGIQMGISGATYDEHVPIKFNQYQTTYT